MNLDLKLTSLGLKIKNFIVVDLSFPETRFVEFKKAFPDRHIHLQCMGELAPCMCGGLASFGKIVLLYNSKWKECDLPDSTLNVKLIKHDKEAVWDYFEEGMQEFGPSVLLIPEED